jgi:hypothetical protein
MEKGELKTPHPKKEGKEILAYIIGTLFKEANNRRR